MYGFYNSLLRVKMTLCMCVKYYNIMLHTMCVCVCVCVCHNFQKNKNNNPYNIFIKAYVPILGKCFIIIINPLLHDFFSKVL